MAATRVESCIAMTNENLIIESVRKGDTNAFRQLVEMYQDYVFTIAMRILNNREEAEEAAQDAFLKAWKGLPGFEAKAKFATWLYRIAWRAAIDRLRSRPKSHTSIDNADKHLQVLDQEPTPSEEIEAEDARRVLEEAIGQMEPEDAALISLYYQSERTVKEIAEITGLTESNIKVKLFRLRSHLKGILERQLQSEVKNLL